MADYPSAIYEPRTKENKEGEEYDPDKTTQLYAEDIVYDDDEIVAIETELGLEPKGDFEDVTARLDNVSDHIGALSAHGVIVVPKTDSENLNNSTTLQNDDELVIALEASSKYYIEVYLFPYVRDVAGFKWKFTVPAMVVGKWAYGNNGPEAELDDWTTTKYVLNGTDFYPCIMMRGWLQTLQTAGNFQLQWAQQVSDADYITLLAGSMIKAIKIT